MKRQNDKSKADSRKKTETSLLRWARDAQQAADSDIIVKIDETNMHFWDVVFTTNMFRNDSHVFEFQKDDDSFEQLSDSLQAPLQQLYNSCRIGESASTCVQFGTHWYEYSVDNDGFIWQKNLSTDKRRSVRRKESNYFVNALIDWFKRFGNGRVPGIHLRLCFYQDFPLSPPFVRVVCPRFMQWTGHVTIGGSICTEDLTATGWKADMTVMGLLLQLKNNMVEGHARIDMLNHHDYTEEEAQEAFKRVARDHGWQLPSQKKAAAKSFDALPL